MKQAVILINGGGGSAGADDVAGKVHDALAAAGIAGKVELLDGAGVARRATEAVAARAPLVIAGGADDADEALERGEVRHARPAPATRAPRPCPRDPRAR